MKVVSSESEFSKDWLGRSECYLRSLRFKGTTPSVGCVAICASKLQHYGVVMQKVDEHKRLGALPLCVSAMTVTPTSMHNLKVHGCLHYEMGI